MPLALYLCHLRATLDHEPTETPKVPVEPDELARLVQHESQSEEPRQVLSTFGQRQAAITERPSAKLVTVRAECLDASA